MMIFNNSQLQISNLFAKIQFLDIAIQIFDERSRLEKADVKGHD